MIVEYNELGLITHVINDPVPEGLHEVMTNAGAVFLDLPPIVEKDIDDDGIESIKAIHYAEVNVQTDYVSLPEKEIAVRPVFEAPTDISIALGSSHQLTGLPAGTEVWMDGQKAVIDDGVLDLDGDMLAEYQLVLMNGIYVPRYIKVTVHEAVSE